MYNPQLRFSVACGNSRNLFIGQNRLLTFEPKTVEVHDLSDGRLLYSLDLKGRFQDIAVFESGEAFAIVSGDQGSIHRVESGEEMFPLEGKLSAVAGSPDGKLLAVAGGGSVRLFQCSDGTLFGQAEVKDTGHTLDFHPSGRYLGVSTVEGAWIFSLPGLQKIAELPATNTDIKFSDCGRFVAAWLIDPDHSQIRVHSTDDWTRVGIVKPASQYAFALGGDMIAGHDLQRYKSKDASVGVWSTADFSQVWSMREPGAAFAVSGDGRLLAHDGLSSDAIRVYAVESGEQVFTLERREFPSGLSFHPSARILAATTWKELMVWDY